MLNKLRDASHLLDSSTLIYFGEWSDYGFEHIAMRHLEDRGTDVVDYQFQDTKKLSKAMIDMYHDIHRHAQTYF